MGCGRRLKIAQVGGGDFFLYTKGGHASAPSFGKRKNSTLGWVADDQLRSAIDQGAQPGGVHVSMTNSELERLKELGQDPLQHKKKKGGLPGASNMPQSPKSMEHNVRYT